MALIAAKHANPIFSLAAPSPEKFLIAAYAIDPRVFPGEALHFEYSTSKGVPGG